MNSVINNKDSSVAFFNSFPSVCKTSSVAGITSAATYAFARISQIFTMTSDERQLEIYSKRINDFTFDSSTKFNIAFKNVNAGLFLYLSNKKFTTLVKNGAILYFQQKIEKGEETLASVNKKFNVKSGSLNDLFAKVDIKEIFSIIGNEDLVQFIEQSPLRHDWRDFQLVIQRYVDSKATRLVEKCQKKFMGLFSPTELQGTSSWKIFLAKQLVDVKEVEMPAFARVFLANLKSGLPEGYEQKVGLFTKCQSAIVSVVHRKIAAVRERIFNLIPISILARPSIEKSESEFITDAAGSCVDFKYTENFPLKPKGLEGESFEQKYQGDIIIARIIRDCFQVYKGRISEDDFHEAYKKWNRMEADPKALDALVEKKIEEVRLKSIPDDWVCL
ncbi:MAG: hypothetical protein NTX49_06715 [Chlamydiae bacterium]|nr:hypothetical protein [Chlamydiota bacterium]